MHRPVISSMLVIFAISGIMFSGSILSQAYGHGLVDQNNPGPFTQFCTILFFGNPLLSANWIGQEFKPTKNNLVAVEVELVQIQLVSAQPITVNIWDGFIGSNAGVPLGTTIQHTGLPGVGNTGVVHFDFPVPVPTVPGNTYVLQLVANDNLADNIWAWQLTGDTYLPTDPDGQAFCKNNGNPFPVLDYIFSTFYEEEEGAAIGGELLSIDSAALLLAGIQSSAIWMLPVLVGTAGVGAFYIKTRMKKD